MYHFHANVFRTPTHFTAGEPLLLRGVSVTPLVGPNGGPPLFDQAFPKSWEEVQTAMLELPRMDCEPDGYFVIAGAAAGERWQVDGHLYEHAGELHRMELHGHCPATVFDELLTPLGWPAAAVVLQLVQEGVTLSEAEFRAWAVSAC